MKKSNFKYIIPVLAVVLLTGCKKFLDINSDPDTTQEPSSASVLPPCLAAIPTALQVDGGTYVAKYTQNWLTGSAANANVYDLHGYTWSGATMAATWTMTYLSGNNLEYIIENSTKLNQPEFVGVALALKAWQFQHTTDYNSDVPFSEAFIPEKFVFKYDTQEQIYRGVDSICRKAIGYLNTAMAKSSSVSSLVARGDFAYNGNLLRWKRFAFGVMARNWNHLSNKASYNADSVIKYCDSSFVAADDDFVIPFDATINANANYFGTYRNNMGNLRQSNFIVRLLDGTALAGAPSFANRDPRIAYMLSASNDTTNGNGGYRGVDPGTGDPYYALGAPSTYLVNGVPPTSGTALTNYNNSRKKVALAFGDSVHVNPGADNFGIAAGKYLFQNKAVHPVMTYAEIQFIKAEAALRKGLRDVAYTAYKNGINGHYDFINRSYSSVRGALNLYSSAPIPAASRTRYLASASVKQNSTTLTLTDIMLQKYIAMWGWGFTETWVDMRRFHYTDLDPATGAQVYNTLVLPAFSTTNEGKPVQRVRPHYTSEFTYNYAQLDSIGALKSTYHTKEMWFSMP